MVHSYKNLGVHLDDKLEWAGNTTRARAGSTSKGTKRLQCLQQDAADVLPVYGGQYCLCCSVLGTEREDGDANQLNKLVRKASSVVGGKVELNWRQ